jgi:hypothetical protein
VQLPLDVDEHCQDIHVLEQASKVDPDIARTESTSLTAFLHILRLRRIESSIQQTIYRVDQSTNVTDAEIEFYLDQLENWKRLIPLDAKKQVDRESTAFDGYDYHGMLEIRRLHEIVYANDWAVRIAPSRTELHARTPPFQVKGFHFFHSRGKKYANTQNDR